jgi:hypothetical protein
MAKRNKSRVYDVTFEGEYFKGENASNSLQPYRETVRLNDEHRVAGFTYVFKNFVAPRLMKTKYTGFGGLHTHHLVSAVDINDPDYVPNDPAIMNLDQLVAFVKHNELPIKIDIYESEDDLRQAVIDCLNDEESFVAAQNKRVQSRGDEIGLAQSINALNPNMGVGLTARADTTTVKTDRIPDAEDTETPTAARPSGKIQTDKFTAEELGMQSKPKNAKKKADLDEDGDDLGY